MVTAVTERRGFGTSVMVMVRVWVDSGWLGILAFGWRRFPAEENHDGARSLRSGSSAAAGSHGRRLCRSHAVLHSDASPGAEVLRSTIDLGPVALGPIVPGSGHHLALFRGEGDLRIAVGRI